MKKPIDELKNALRISSLYTLFGWVLPRDLKNALKTGDDEIIHHAIMVMRDNASFSIRLFNDIAQYGSISISYILSRIMTFMLLLYNCHSAP